VTGLLQPTVLIPAEASGWSRADLDMALAHEALHILRRDLWHGLVPSAAARFFFFHPLARLAAREYSFAREAACDAQTLALVGANPTAYAELLVRFGVRRRRMVSAIGGASTTFRILKRRLLMLHDIQQQTHVHPWRIWAGVALLLLLTIPFRLSAQDRQPSPAAPAQRTAVEAPIEVSTSKAPTIEAPRRAPAIQSPTAGAPAVETPIDSSPVSTEAQSAELANRIEQELNRLSRLHALQDAASAAEALRERLANASQEQRQIIQEQLRAGESDTARLVRELAVRLNQVRSSTQLQRQLIQLETEHGKLEDQLREQHPDIASRLSALEKELERVKVELLRLQERLSRPQ